MNVHIIKPNEDWILDRIGNEYEANSRHTICSIENAHVVWNLSSKVLHYRRPKMVSGIQHIVPEKFKKELFDLKDSCTDIWLTHSPKTKTFLSNYTTKPIYCVPYWVNTSLWYPQRRYDNYPQSFLIGSFQRDSEGADPTKPKLEKGPDIFVDWVKKISKIINKPIMVVLTGPRRDYIKEELSKNNIRYIYYPDPSMAELNNLYSILDLYLITSRIEGGPQAVLECAITRTPVLSTNVGIVDLILHQDCILDISTETFSLPTKAHIDYAYGQVLNYSITNQVKAIDDIFEQLNENTNNRR